MGPPSGGRHGGVGPESDKHSKKYKQDAAQYCAAAAAITTTDITAAARTRAAVESAAYAHPRS